MTFDITQRLRIRLNQYRYKFKTSQPFLSGDAFKELSDISFESHSQIADEKINIRQARLIFCKSDLVESLIANLKSRSTGISLIAGNSDRNFDLRLPKLLEHFDYVYLQNSLISDNKRIFTLPIGVENLKFGINGLPSNLRSLRSWQNRDKSLVIGPFSPTHESRLLAISGEELGSGFTVIKERLSPKQYAAVVNEHRFVLCPRGNGIDTHRFWETLYRGAIPIVLANNWSRSLTIHGFPFIQLEDFSSASIKKGIAEFENSHPDYRFDPLTTKSLWVDYWERLFRK